MPPIRQTDYAKHAGLSKGHVSNLVRAGMPLTSLEAADQWRGMSAEDVQMTYALKWLAEQPKPQTPVTTATPAQKSSPGIAISVLTLGLLVLFAGWK